MVLMMNTVPAASAALAEASSPSGCAILWIQAFVRLGNIFRGFPVVRGFIYSIYSVENILQYRRSIHMAKISSRESSRKSNLIFLV